MVKLNCKIFDIDLNDINNSAVITIEIYVYKLKLLYHFTYVHNKYFVKVTSKKQHNKKYKKSKLFSIYNSK